MGKLEFVRRRTSEIVKLFEGVHDLLVGMGSAKGTAARGGLLRLAHRKQSEVGTLEAFNRCNPWFKKNNQEEHRGV